MKLTDPLGEIRGRLLRLLEFVEKTMKEPCSDAPVCGDVATPFQCECGATGPGPLCLRPGCKRPMSAMVPVAKAPVEPPCPECGWFGVHRDDNPYCSLARRKPAPPACEDWRLTPMGPTPFAGEPPALVMCLVCMGHGRFTTNGVCYACKGTGKVTHPCQNQSPSVASADTSDGSTAGDLHRRFHSKVGCAGDECYVCDGEDAFLARHPETR